MTAETDRVYRSAGLLESYHIARQNAKLDSCVVVAARFVRTTPTTENQNAGSGTESGRLSKEEVYAALVHTLTVHAALSVRAVRKGSGKKEEYVFERLGSVNFEKAVRFLDDEDSTNEDIAALIQRQFTEPAPSALPTSDATDTEKDKAQGLSESTPLWRLTVTPHNTLIFAWNHCIGDGQSGLAVLRTILAGLNLNVNSTLPVPVDFDPKNVQVPVGVGLKLTPRLEELTDVSVSLFTMLSELVGSLVPPSWTSARKTWTGHTIPPAPSSPTRARVVSIPPEQVSRILKAARAKKTTLTAVFYSLSADVLSDLIIKEKENAKKWKRLLISVPVSLRNVANVPLTAMGEMFSTHLSKRPLHFSSPPPSSSPSSPRFNNAEWWTRTSTFSQTLHASLLKTREVIGSIKLLNGRYESFFKGKLGKKRQASLEISNLGVFKLDVDVDVDVGTKAKSKNTSINPLKLDFDSTPDESASDSKKKKWTITESYFAQDDGTTGAALKVNVVGSPSGTDSVNIVVTWGKDAVDDAFAEEFVKELQEAVGKLHRELLELDSGGDSERKGE